MLRISSMLMKVVILALVSCSKEEVASTPAELLTRAEWRLSALGYDENGNAVVDPEEELISDCQTDNTYLFRTGGTVTIYDNYLSCNGISEQTVQWKLVNNNSQIDLQFYVASIARLTVHEMILFQQHELANGGMIRFLTVFRH